jgi:hypothetical protein
MTDADPGVTRLCSHFYVSGYPSSAPTSRRAGHKLDTIFDNNRSLYSRKGTPRGNEWSIGWADHLVQLGRGDKDWINLSRVDRAGDPHEGLGEINWVADEHLPSATSSVECHEE